MATKPRFLGEEARYSDLGEDFFVEQEVIQQVQTTLPERPLDEVSPEQVTANQNNYSLPDAGLARFSTDAARTITGFAGAKSNFKMIVNVGSFNLTLAHDSGSSDAENRIIFASAADVTLSPGQMVVIYYDLTSARWRGGRLS